MGRGEVSSRAVACAVAAAAIGLALVNGRQTRCDAEKRKPLSGPEPELAASREYHRMVRSRLDDQAAAHWHEFSLIVASGSNAVAIVAAGLLFAQPVERGARVLLGGMLLASVAAFALAYFSIQAGTVAIVGPLDIWEVLGSFVIAGAQLAMPLWIGYVLRQNTSIESVGDVLSATRHWFGFYALFGVFGALTNLREAVRRRRTAARAVLPSAFNRRQLEDRCGAMASGASAACMWIAMAFWTPHWWTAVALTYLYGFVMMPLALFNQSATLKLLDEAL